MLIVHEGLPVEARDVALLCKEVYGIPSKIMETDLSRHFRVIPQLQGYYLPRRNGQWRMHNVLMLTKRDIFANGRNEGDWLFGCCMSVEGGTSTMVVSTARLKGNDSSPSDALSVPYGQYLRRVSAIALHEVGHDVIASPHFEPMRWYSSGSDHALDLGDHCVDRFCVMHPVVDVQTPPASQGHVLKGKIPIRALGLDDHLATLRSDWLCDYCQKSISVPETYKQL